MLEVTESLSLADYDSLFAELSQQPVYKVKQQEKAQRLLSCLNWLHQYHQQHCAAYNNIVSASKQTQTLQKLEDLPFLAVRLFKHLSLKSITDEQVFRVLQSSGTTAQTPARVFLDRATSSRQSKVLVKILQQHVGKQRLPMLIVDSPSVIQDKTKFSARGAGIQGLMFFGRDHHYALDNNMRPDWASIEKFCDKYAGQPVLLFGFTFMLWQHLIQELEKAGKFLPLEQGILLHSGGWKKLESQKVDNHTFKARIKQQTGIESIANFYGMAEQVGSVFVECQHGHLHTPVFAHVIVRNPQTLAPCEPGQTGLIQVLSCVPTSYPGFSLLTEDLGVVLGEDDCLCGRKGTYFSVHGRLPKTEVRGCSDTHSGV